MEFMVRLEKSEPDVAKETVAFPGALTEAITPPTYVIIMLLPKSSVIDERCGFSPITVNVYFIFLPNLSSEQMILPSASK